MSAGIPGREHRGWFGSDARDGQITVTSRGQLFADVHTVSVVPSVRFELTLDGF